MSDSYFAQEKHKVAIIGCGNNADCYHGPWHIGDQFFTIDTNEKVSPDYVADITDETSFISNKGQFELTIIEHLPIYCYNGFIHRLDGYQGFSKKRKVDACVTLINALIDNSGLGQCINYSSELSNGRLGGILKENRFSIDTIQLKNKI